MLKASFRDAATRRRKKEELMESLCLHFMDRQPQSNRIKFGFETWQAPNDASLSSEVSQLDRSQNEVPSRSKCEAKLKSDITTLGQISKRVSMSLKQSPRGVHVKSEVEK